MIEELKKILADKDAYDLVSALRGDDYEFAAMKYVFTARIRYFLGIGSWAGVIRDTEYISEERAEDFKVEVENAIKQKMSLHYLDHILFALEALVKLKLMPEFEASELSALAMITEGYMLNKNSNSRGLMYEALDGITKEGGADE